MGFLTAFSRVVLDMTVSSPLLLFVVLHYLLFFIVIASMRSRGPSLPLLRLPLDMELHGELTSVSNNSSAKKGSDIVLFDLCALVPLLHILCSCLAKRAKVQSHLEDPGAGAALAS